ncbi:hypothetical protein [Georgenia alba]|uniref:Uncharacterized protein n=1 Tax=Georgenia alba TaxID=2233858 RepID=A0ABW2Q5L1_9MICO
MGPADLAIRATRAQVLSARPNAPVVPDPEPRHRIRRSRAALAAALHHLAERLEPSGGRLLTDTPGAADPG